MDITVYDIAVVPVIIGLVAGLTKLGLPKKLGFVVSIALGIVAGVVYISPGDTAQGIYVGIVAGLSASGLYSGAKNGIESITKK